MKIVEIATVLAACTAGFCAGSFLRADHSTDSEESVKKTAKISEFQWSTIKDFSFAMDMEALEVTLIKRSFNPSDGSEITLVECKNGDRNYYCCSKEVHEKLVVQFQEILKKKETEGP